MPRRFSLPQLRIPVKTDAWAWRHEMFNGQARREAFIDLVKDTGLNLPDRLSRMRTLIDMGLWEDVQATPAPSSSWIRKAARWFEGASGPQSLPSHEETQRARFSQCFVSAISPGQPVEVLQLLIEAGLDLGACQMNSPGHSPLQMAVRHGLVEHVRLLLAAGSDPNVAYPSFESPLNLAIARFAQSPPDDELNLSIVDLLLENHAILEPSEPRSLPLGCVPSLWYAVSTFNPAIVRRLLDAGARVDGAPEHGVCPIWVYALISGKVSPWSAPMCEAFAKIGKMLVVAGADIEEMSPSGLPPLLCAASKSNLPALLTLLDLGADPTVRDEQGETLAHHIVFNFEPDDEGMAAVLDRIAPGCWRWLDNQGRGPGDVLKAKCEEYGMDDYEVGPWRNLIEHEHISSDTPLLVHRRRGPRL